MITIIITAVITAVIVTAFWTYFDSIENGYELAKDNVTVTVTKNEENVIENVKTYGRDKVIKEIKGDI